MTAYRIGRAPRLPRRKRLARALNQGGRYLLAYALTGWACMWLVDVHLFVPGLVLAALLANPWRSRKSRPGVVDAAVAVGRGAGAGALSQLRRAGRAGQLSVQAPVRT